MQGHPTGLSTHSESPFSRSHKHDAVLQPCSFDGFLRGVDLSPSAPSFNNPSLRVYYGFLLGNVNSELQYIAYAQEANHYIYDIGRKIELERSATRYKLVCTKGDKAGRAFTLLPISPAKMN